jgi:hypothetical protein
MVTKIVLYGSKLTYKEEGLERKNKITVPDKMKIHILEHAH